jgi:hypothetical protein
VVAGAVETLEQLLAAAVVLVAIEHQLKQYQ